jgi:hypothetical protein
MPLDVTTTEDLLTLEAKLKRTESLSSLKAITARLSRNLRKDFFIEARVAAILTTLAQRFQLTTQDWHNEWEDDQIEIFFNTAIVGLTAAVYSHTLTNMAGTKFPGKSASMLERVATAGGILEPKGRRGSSITFCAFDPAWSEPAAFAGTLNTPYLFKRTFAAYRAKYLEIGTGLQRTEKTREADDKLEDFIFELYQNTYEHGRLDENNVPIQGMRYVRMVKYIEQKKEHFLAKAGGLSELKDYLTSVIPDQGEFKFYEIAISDHGLGMIGRLRATRPDIIVEESVESRTDLLNEILTRSLTSKRHFPGSGYGLPRALRAISQLQGFISLRTDRSWLVGHAAGGTTRLEHVGLRPVSKAGELPYICGTHFSILLPMRVN